MNIIELKLCDRDVIIKIVLLFLHIFNRSPSPLVYILVDCSKVKKLEFNYSVARINLFSRYHHSSKLAKDTWPREEEDASTTVEVLYLVRCSWSPSGSWSLYSAEC